MIWGLPVQEEITKITIKKAEYFWVQWRRESGLMRARASQALSENTNLSPSTRIGLLLTACSSCSTRVEPSHRTSSSNGNIWNTWRKVTRIWNTESGRSKELKLESLGEQELRQTRTSSQHTHLQSGFSDKQYWLNILGGLDGMCQSWNFDMPNILKKKKKNL